MKYMLDTNIIIYIQNHRSPEALNILTHHSPSDICISSITMAELEYGVYKSSRPGQNQIALVTFLSQTKIMPFETKAAVEYGRIRADLSRQGRLIGANDLLIAAHAKALGLTLVTNNTREFSRVKGLKLENWYAESA